MEDKYGFMIYSVKWRRHICDGIDETFKDYKTDWILNVEDAIKMKNELEEKAKTDKSYVFIRLIEEFVVCTKDEIDNISHKTIPLIEIY